MLPELRPEAQDLIARVKDFIEQECIPSEHIFHEQIEEGENRWNSYPAVTVSYTHLTLPTKA